MGLTVRDTLSDRKYRDSYQQVASALRTINLPAEDLQAFFGQVAFSVMVRNGDGHLKNYGVIYGADKRPRLSPMYDVVTTAIYRYARLSGGQDLEDKTLALKLFAGRNSSRVYPTTEELLRFGREVCGVERPGQIVRTIAQALAETLQSVTGDERIAGDLLAQIGSMWGHGLQYAREVETAGWR